MPNLNILTNTALVTTALLLSSCGKTEAEKKAASYMEVRCDATECVQDFIRKEPLKPHGLSSRAPQYRTTEWVSVHSPKNYDIFRQNTDSMFSRAGWIRVPKSNATIHSQAKDMDLICSMRYSSTTCWSRRLQTVISNKYGIDFITNLEDLNQIAVDTDDEKVEEEP